MDTSRERARAEASRIVRDIVGVEDASVVALLDAARTTLGAERTAWCIERVRRGPLSRRSYELAHVASLIVGTRALGLAWWDRTSSEGSLSEIAYALWDDVADQLWGPAIGFVDMNAPHLPTRIPPWQGGAPGDTRVASFDPGARLDVVITLVDGRHVTFAVGETCRESPPAEAWWGWATLAGDTILRLPDEHGASDPYAVLVPLASTETLRIWARSQAPELRCADTPWRTRGDLVSALAAVDPRGRDGRWFVWARAMNALVDGNDTPLPSLD